MPGFSHVILSNELFIFRFFLRFSYQQPNLSFSFSLVLFLSFFQSFSLSLSLSIIVPRLFLSHFPLCLYPLTRTHTLRVIFCLVYFPFYFIIFSFRLFGASQTCVFDSFPCFHFGELVSVKSEVVLGVIRYELC